MNILDLVAIMALCIGVSGIIYKTVYFVKVTIPANFGNPGFGCYEVSILLWLAFVVTGIGILINSYVTGILIFFSCVFLAGFFAQLLEKIFYRH